jgi:hypothetical protein
MIGLGRVESESEFDTGFELVNVFVSNALAPLLLPIVALLSPQPSFVSVSVRRPRSLLVEGKGRRRVWIVRDGTKDHVERESRVGGRGMVLKRRILVVRIIRHG